jgi:DNA-binding SARP family transcriptional activator
LASSTRLERASLALLGRFELIDHGAIVPLAPASQRLLAYVALAGRRVRRDGVAGALWSGESEHRAHTNLRSAIARVGARAPGLLFAAGAELALADTVCVDLEHARRVALQVISPAAAAAVESAALPLSALSAELLPGWYDDWVVNEAEIWRQLRLHALEALSRTLTTGGRYAEAVVTAQAAVAGDPLRESAHAALIAVHLREGNQSEAVRTYERYRRRLHDELGLAPTAQIRDALGHATVT